MKHFIRLRLKNLTAICLSLCMAATFAVPFFAYPNRLMADTQDDLDAVNKQLEELRNKQSELNASYGELNEKLSASGEKLSSIEDADQIIVLDDGNVAGIGTHEELLENCEVYQEIYYSQFRKEKEA